MSIAITVNCNITVVWALWKYCGEKNRWSSKVAKVFWALWRYCGEKSQWSSKIAKWVEEHMPTIISFIRCNRLFFPIRIMKKPTIPAWNRSGFILLDHLPQFFHVFEDPQKLFGQAWTQWFFGQACITLLKHSVTLDHQGTIGWLQKDSGYSDFSLRSDLKESVDQVQLKAVWCKKKRSYRRFNYKIQQNFLIILYMKRFRVM